MAARHTLATGYHPKRRKDWWDDDSPAGRYLAAIRVGMPKHLAAQAAGVSDSAVLKWRNRAEEIDETAEKMKVSDRMHLRFFRCVADAEADLAFELIDGWRQTAQTDWRAAQAFLARRFPEDEPADRVEVSGPQGGPVRVEALPLADLVTAARERAIAEAAGE
jgi:hypothetical protein